MAYQSISVNVDKGLFLQPNSFTHVPQGGLEKAENVVFVSDGLVTKRRGYSILNTSITNPYSIFKYRDDLYISNNDIVSRVDTDTGVLTNLIGSVGQKSIRFTTLNGNCYLTSDGGVKKLEASNATQLIDAGVPPPLDLELSINSADSGVIEPDSQVAYRIIQGRKDANGNLILSAPTAARFIANTLVKDVTASETSGTVTVTSPSHGLSTLDTIVVKNAADSGGGIVTNIAGEWQITVTDANTFTFDVARTPSGTLAQLDYGVYKNIDVEFTIPDDITTENFYQIYRTSQSAGEDIIPTEDLQLVYESNYTSAQITAGFVQHTDSTDDLLKGAYCYTNPNSGEGILNANDLPPQSEDVAAFKNHLFYANTVKRNSIQIDLITVDTLANDDVITIDGIAYTAKSAEDVASREFLLDKSGTPAQNIATTSRSLCRVINRSADSTVTCEYISGYIDLPGKMLMKAKEFDNQFSVQANTVTAGSSFNPELPTDTSNTSAQDDNPNRVYISKFQEPEAVPSTSYIDVGSKEEEILRLVALRDSLIIITNKSIYRLNGNTRNDFTTTTLDTTVGCVAADSVALLGNRAYMLSNQGVVAVSDGGVQVVSRAIEKAINSSLVKTNINTASAFSDESDRNYIITMLNPDSNEVDAFTTFVYNYVTNAWSEFPDLLVSSALSLKDRIYLLNDSGVLKKERKDRVLTDYTEDDFTCSVVAVNSETELVVDSVSSGYSLDSDQVIVVSDTVYRISNVVEDELISGQFTITLQDWLYDVSVSDTLKVYTGIRSEIELAPMTLGSVGNSKMCSNIETSFRNGNISKLEYRFQSNFSGSAANIAYSDSSTSGWGTTPFGTSGWGDADTSANIYDTQSSKIIKRYLPREVSRFSWLKSSIIHDQPCESFEVQAVSFDVKVIGSKNTRD